MRVKKMIQKLKKRIVKFAISMKPKLKEKYRKIDVVGSCTVCGEASSGTICRTCQMLQAFHAES